MSVDELAPLLSEEGWPYASTPPVEAGDPGRFNALFGRDSLICSLQVAPEEPNVVAATLRALAARQGTRDNPDTCEEPGKIGHEFRDRAPQGFLDLGWPDQGAFAYYGTADATSWFLFLVANACAAELADELEPSWRAAAGWLDRALERGGGLVRHVPGDWPALTQQGWRDTVDPTAAYGGGILRLDGTAPHAPLADADSQAIAYAALKSLTALDPDGGWEDKARALRARLSAVFTPDVMAIEAGDRPVPGAGSQLGWLLWAGALDDDARDAAAERLCFPDILTDYGLRTLSSDSPVFDPHHYHRGSVWPFDSWIGWGGLRAAGWHAEAQRVRHGVLAALDQLGRSPELYAVARGGAVEPVALSNRVQAWTVGARWAFENDWDGLSPR
jgi:glycogen debranching enzyme